MMQASSWIGGLEAITSFATWHRRLGSVINRRRSAVLGYSLILSLLRFGMDLRGIRIFAYMRL